MMKKFDKKKYMKEWYKKNREKLKLYHRKYQREHREEINKSDRKRYQKNREKIREKCRKWREKNREKCRLYTKKDWEKHKEKRKLSRKKWGEENRELLRMYQRTTKYRKKRYERHCRRFKTDTKYRLSTLMTGYIYKALRDKKTGYKWETLVGYTVKELIKYLENQFDNKMNWNNHGKYWQIDHIKPISLFHYTSQDDLEFKECWSLKNLQPLEKTENLKKSNNYLHT